MKILVFGGGGLVGSRFIELNKLNMEIKAPGAEQVDILNKDQILQIIESFNPDSVINFAAYTNVQEAENQKDEREGICYQINAIGAKNVAEACKLFDKHLVFISTEYVFDGTKEISPYVEDDKPNPVNWYGATKLFGEEYVFGSGCISTIVRISMPFRAKYEIKKDIARFFLEQLKLGNSLKGVDDQNITPTLVDDIVQGLKTILQNKSEGIYHISSKDSVTPLEFAKTIARLFGLSYALIDSITLDEFNKDKKAKFVKYSWLNPQKFEKEFGDDILHTVEEALVIFKQQIDQAS